MKVGIIGASGLVGSALRLALETAGHQWVGFSRNPQGRAGEWRQMREGFEGMDAVVNVAGDAIDKRWTEENKRRFHESRVGVTQEIVRLFSQLSVENRPRLLLNASAVGFYGDQGDRVLNENSPPGPGYLAELCEEWETAAEVAKSLGVRVVFGRIGVVLASEARAWRRMKLIFELGGGGTLGKGSQYWPVVHLDDVVGGMVHVMENEEIQGPVNLVGPHPVTNAQFTKVLASVLRRPAVLPVPAFALHLVFGQFASALLASYRAKPSVLLESGYHFQHPELRSMLVSLKGRELR